jgi:hypothetical protein
LGVPEPKRPGIPTLGVRPPDGQKALSEQQMISDGLSDTDFIEPSVGKEACQGSADRPCPDNRVRQ